MSTTTSVSGITFGDGTTQNTATYAAASNWSNSQAASGYQKLPSGLYIQWGNFATGSVGATGAAFGTLTFPNAFPTACFNVIFNPSRSTNAFVYMGSYGAPTATTCSWFINNASGSSQSPNAHWLAIGN